MFNRSNDDAHAKNVAAQKARREALIESGQMGAPSFAPCAMAPGTDKVTVQRVGPKATATTLVGVSIETSQGFAFANLTPANARRIAVAMLDAADEADAVTRLVFSVEPHAGYAEGAQP